jgi:ribonuclease BN (tRNA processing enzyme)
MNFSLTILGSASGQPVPDRAHAALALHCPGEIYLLDAGEGASSALLRWGLDPLAIKGVFITHTHPDHCVGIFMILQYMHMKRHEGPVDIYLPESAIKPLQDFMNAVYLVPGQISTEYRLLALKQHHALSDDWALETFPTQHLKRWEELALPGVGSQAYAFRVNRPGHGLVYSGDIASFDDVAGIIRPDDLPVVEGTHIDVGQVLDWALDKGLKRIVLTHVLPDADWVNGDLVNQARQRGLDIIFAADGLSLSF